MCVMGGGGGGASGGKKRSRDLEWCMVEKENNYV